MTTPEPLPRPARTCTTLGRIWRAAASVLPAAALPPAGARCCTIVGPAAVRRGRGHHDPGAGRAAGQDGGREHRRRGGAGVGSSRVDGAAVPAGRAAAGAGAGRSRCRGRAGGPAQPDRGPAGVPETGLLSRPGVVMITVPSSVGMGQISRENQRRDRAPAPTATSRPRAARYGVTSRCSVRQPIEEPMSAYTSRSCSPLSAV